MKFKVFNHKAPADHKFQNSVIDTTKNPDAFARLVMKACGDGMNPGFVAKAMETSTRLMTLMPGQEHRIHTRYVDLRCDTKEVDITLTRIED